MKDLPRVGSVGECFRRRDLDKWSGLTFEIVAHHEAGHAVVALDSGLRVVSIEVGDEHGVVTTANDPEPIDLDTLTQLGGTAGEIRQPHAGGGGFAHEPLAIFRRCNGDIAEFTRLVTLVDGIVDREAAAHAAIVEAILDLPTQDSPTEFDSTGAPEQVRILGGDVVTELWRQNAVNSAE